MYLFLRRYLGPTVASGYISCITLVIMLTIQSKMVRLTKLELAQKTYL